MRNETPRASAPAPDAGRVSTLVRHTGTYLVARGGPAVLNFATLIYLTHALDAAAYGRYAVIAATAILAVELGYSGLLGGVRRFLPAHAEDPAPFLRTVLWSTLGFVGLAGLLGAVVALVLPSIDKITIIAIWALASSQVWFNLHLEFKAIRLRPLEYGLLSGSRAGLTFLLVWGAIKLGWGFHGVIAAMVLGYLLPTFGQLAAAWRGVGRAQADPSTARTLLAYGWPLAANYGLAYVVNFSDRLLLASLAGVAAAGVYSASYDLTQQTVLVIMMVVNTAAFPLVATALERRGSEAARDQLRVHIEVLLALGLPATVGFAVLAPNLSRTLLGQEFRAGGAVLAPIVAFAVFLAGIKAYYFDLAFQLGRRTTRQPWITAVAAILVTILNLLWIPTYGARGAAWATVAAFVVALGLSVAWGRTSFALPWPAARLGRVVVATAAMAAALLPIRAYEGAMMLGLQVGVGALVYCGAAFALNIGGIRVRVTTT